MTAEMLCDLCRSRGEPACTPCMRTALEVARVEREAVGARITQARQNALVEAVAVCAVRAKRWLESFYELDKTTSGGLGLAEDASRRAREAAECGEEIRQLSVRH